MKTQLVLLMLAAVTLAPTASADHFPGPNPDICQDPNLVVNLVRSTVCLVWIEGIAPAYHIAAEFIVTVRDAALDACESVNGSPCT